MAVPAPVFTRVVEGRDGGGENLVLWPLSEDGSTRWRGRSEADIRSALRSKVLVGRMVASGEIRGTSSRGEKSSGSITV